MYKILTKKELKETLDVKVIDIVVGKVTYTFVSRRKFNGNLFIGEVFCIEKNDWDTQIGSIKYYDYNTHYYNLYTKIVAIANDLETGLAHIDSIWDEHTVEY